MAVIHVCDYPSPLGKLLLAEEEEALVGAWFEGQKYFGASLPEETVHELTPVLMAATRWLDTYFSGATPGPLPPLCPRGTPFRQTVWALLLEIPYGQTVTYGALAKQMAEKNGQKRISSQAVGGAVGHNPVSIFIPCHRVVGADGSLTGYAGGLEKKKALLALEASHSGSF